MFYVTTLRHSTFDLGEGEETGPVSQVLSDDGLLYDANIYYHGHTRILIVRMLME